MISVTKTGIMIPPDMYTAIGSPAKVGLVAHATDLFIGFGLGYAVRNYRISRATDIIPGRYECDVVHLYGLQLIQVKNCLYHNYYKMTQL